MPEKISDEEVQITITCPDCGHQVVKTVAWLKQNDFLHCAACGETSRSRNKETQAVLDGLTKINIGLAILGQKRR